MSGENKGNQKASLCEHCFSILMEKLEKEKFKIYTFTKSWIKELVQSSQSGKKREFYMLVSYEAEPPYCLGFIG
jgi:hypothetical protein